MKEDDDNDYYHQYTPTSYPAGLMNEMYEEKEDPTNTRLWAPGQKPAEQPKQAEKVEFPKTIEKTLEERWEEKAARRAKIVGEEEVSSMRKANRMFQSITVTDSEKSQSSKRQVEAGVRAEMEENRQKNVVNREIAEEKTVVKEGGVKKVGEVLEDLEVNEK